MIHCSKGVKAKFYEWTWKAELTTRIFAQKEKYVNHQPVCCLHNNKDDDNIGNNINNNDILITTTIIMLLTLQLRSLSLS